MSCDIHNYLVEYGPQYADFRVLTGLLEPLGWLVGVSPYLLNLSILGLSTEVHSGLQDSLSLVLLSEPSNLSLWFRYWKRGFSYL